MRARGNILVFGGPTVIGLWFVYGFALKYLENEPGRFGIYLPRHQWLSAHIVAGILALLAGPVQLWLGLNKKTGIFHYIIGLLYVMSVGVGGTAAFYLARHTDFGWVFGVGLAAMALAWLISTGLATIAILIRRVEQHWEWMIRSYVVTFAFVTLRLLTTIFELARVGTMVERMTAAAWLAWTVPLLITETILQGRKIFARRPSAKLLPDANVYTAAPEPVEFGLPSSESSYSHRP